MKKIIIYILIGIIIALLGYIAIYRWLNSRPDLRFGSDRAAIIVQTQSLARFETASFSIDKVIEAQTPYEGIRQFLFGDKIILIAHGNAIAGYDLSQLKPQDFTGIGSEITVHLPPAQIFTVALDNEQTRVFDRSQGIFTKGQINLEAQARQEAEASIRVAACEGGILDAAAQNAKKQLEILFKSAGFTSVAITVPSAECK